ncbi:MAG: dihydroxyacetone kinase subunit L [bacterium]|nr:dihydroxyacetone kinase subunit L [bacterium]
MMGDSLSYDDVTRMLRGAAAQIRANHELLSKLDSFGGDGDHGTTMVRAMANLDKAIDDCTAGTVKGLLFDVGWAIMGVDGGATGPLFGTLFMSMSEAAGDQTEFDAAGVASLFDSGLAGVRKQTKANPGDKTMIDALVPAVETMRAKADAGVSVLEALDAAAEAAAAGAATTKEMQARFGRAKNIGEKSVGQEDPGAKSTSFVFRGFHEGAKQDA